MFQVNYPIIEYYDRWGRYSFEQRISLLKKGTNRVAYFYDIPDVSTFRYRVYNMVNVINQFIPEYSSAFFHNNDLADIKKIVDNCDLLILCRVNYNDRINWLITYAKAQNVIVVYDIDDLVFNTQYTHLMLNTLDKQLDNDSVWNYWFSYLSRKGEVLKYCDCAITTNQFLAERIAEFVSLTCYIIPNFYNQEQLTVSDNIMQQKRTNNFARNDSIYLGYFSGSSTHNLDFDILSGALIRLFHQHPNLILRIVGMIELKGELKNYQNRIEFCSYTDYVNLQRLIAEVEINLIPLQNNIFTNCKSELKYFEAAIGGTVSIATPTYIYNKVITDGRNGYLSLDFEWESKINHVIAELANYSSIAESAYTHSVDNYAWYNQIIPIKTVLDNIMCFENE